MGPVTGRQGESSMVQITAPGPRESWTPEIQALMDAPGLLHQTCRALLQETRLRLRLHRVVRRKLLAERQWARSSRLRMERRWAVETDIGPSTPPSPCSIHSGGCVAGGPTSCLPAAGMLPLHDHSDDSHQLYHYCTSTNTSAQGQGQGKGGEPSLTPVRMRPMRRRPRRKQDTEDTEDTEDMEDTDNADSDSGASSTRSLSSPSNSHTGGSCEPCDAPPPQTSSSSCRVRDWSPTVADAVGEAVVAEGGGGWTEVEQLKQRQRDQMAVM